MAKIFVRAPVRIDFAGGTTDISPYSSRHTGAVLNAAINRYVYGSLITEKDKTNLEYHADIPTASGLGTSGVMNVVWLALTTSFKERRKLAELAYDIERDTGVVGGKQDQYAAVSGGINFMEFKDKKLPKIERLNLDKNLIKELESKLFLYYTGPRISSKFNKIVFDNICKEKKGTIKTLNEIVRNAVEMKRALMKKDLAEFASLINKEWILRKKLDKRITTKKIEDKIAFAKRNGALAAKVCGAGGGGSILFYADNKKELIKKFKNQVIDFKFDLEGIKIWQGK